MGGRERVPCPNFSLGFWAFGGGKETTNKQ